jgi:hypothetical protein
MKDKHIRITYERDGRTRSAGGMLGEVQFLFVKWHVLSCVSLSLQVKGQTEDDAVLAALLVLASRGYENVTIEDA